MDLGDCDRLFRSLKDNKGPTGTRQQAALELLGLSACPREATEGVLTQRIRQCCYRELDDIRGSHRVPLFPPEESARLREQDCLPSISIDDVVQLKGSPLQFLLDVDLEQLFPARRAAGGAHHHRESDAGVRPAREPRATGREIAQGDGRRLSNPWSRAARSAQRQEDVKPDLRVFGEPQAPWSQRNVAPEAPSDNHMGHRAREAAAQAHARYPFESALKKFKKSNPDYQGVLSNARGSENQDSDPDYTDKRKRGIRSAFVSPMRADDKQGGGTAMRRKQPKEDAVDDATMKCLEELMDEDGQLPERLRNVEPKLVAQICNEILTRDTRITWDDIAGLDHAKECITETIIWPLKRPDLFSGTRAPPKGLLLFGPPGTGKTMIGRAIAGEIEATFFSISASSLTSKWIGEGEKLVRALFGVASCKQPAVIFIDEIDSLLSQRKSDGEHESSRRMKTQFLIEMEGCQGAEEQLLVIGATNRPQELDEAARRRLAKRLYIPLPDQAARQQMVKRLLSKDHLLDLSEADLENIAEMTQGYSGSDMAHLVREASMVPMREALKPGAIASLRKEDVRPISRQDFAKSLSKVRPSVAEEELSAYKDWNKQFGSTDMD